ncbi:hypothetical protein HGRIS_011763 [Hohenbuehelia grisea]
MDSFLEIKPLSSQGIIPNNSDEATVLKTLTQTAEYGCLHLSSRPFQLFSVAVVISGSKFVVVIFDRDGATVSSDFDMWSDTEVFVKVIRQIACGLSPIELGADPSVQELEISSPLYQEIRKKSAALQVLPESFDFPSYRITCPRQLHPHSETPFATTHEVPWVSNQWVTIGPPISSPLSLCGRATTVWRVTRMENNCIVNIDEVCILKNAWRPSDHNSESDIYQSISTRLAGVAEFLQGGDVTMPGSTDVIRVDRLRCVPGRSFVPSAQSTWILHRLVLKTIGRALWDADSFLDIVKGVRAALNGHKSLCSHNILHRDVSTGNVLLSAEPSAKPGEEGFLADLESAHVELIVKEGVPEHPSKNCDITRSNHVRGEEAIKGTVHFMAIQLITDMTDGIRVEYKVHHDVESFIWVLAYAVARHLLIVSSNAAKDSEPDIKEKVISFFNDGWDCRSLCSILTTKRALCPLSLPLGIHPLVPEPILSLFRTLRIIMLEQMLLSTTPDPSMLPRGMVLPKILDHDDLLNKLDQCVANFESPSYDGPK